MAGIFCLPDPCRLDRIRPGRIGSHLYRPGDGELGGFADGYGEPCEEFEDGVRGRFFGKDRIEPKSPCVKAGAFLFEEEKAMDAGCCQDKLQECAQALGMQRAYLSVCTYPNSFDSLLSYPGGPVYPCSGYRDYHWRSLPFWHRFWRHRPCCLPV